MGVCCWTPAGGGKNDVPNRLKRQFALFNVPLPSVAAINGIFGKLVEGRFSADQFSPAVVKVGCQCTCLCVQFAAGGHTVLLRLALHWPNGNLPESFV
jgi:dynein heavy chain